MKQKTCYENPGKFIAIQINNVFHIGLLYFHKMTVSPWKLVIPEQKPN